MTVVASVHFADVGIRNAFGMLRKAPSAADVNGLRHANIVSAVRFSKSPAPSFQPGRVGLIAFWDDESLLDRFVETHPLAAALSAGWRATLLPERAFGTWPGLPDGIARSRTTSYDGPAVVVTLGRLRLPRALRFLRTSAPAEKAAIGAPGNIWATAMVRPPVFATCSIWESTEALSTYAYGAAEAAHSKAIRADRSKAFHHQSAFIRFRPLATEGRLDGRNPLAERVLDST